RSKDADGATLTPRRGRFVWRARRAARLARSAVGNWVADAAGGWTTVSRSSGGTATAWVVDGRVPTASAFASDFKTKPTPGIVRSIRGLLGSSSILRRSR